MQSERKEDWEGGGRLAGLTTHTRHVYWVHACARNCAKHGGYSCEQQRQRPCFPGHVGDMRMGRQCNGVTTKAEEKFRRPRPQHRLRGRDSPPSKASGLTPKGWMGAAGRWQGKCCRRRGGDHGCPGPNPQSRREEGGPASDSCLTPLLPAPQPPGRPRGPRLPAAGSKIAPAFTAGRGRVARPDELDPGEGGPAGGGSGWEWPVQGEGGPGWGWSGGRRPCRVNLADEGGPGRRRARTAGRGAAGRRRPLLSLGPRAWGRGCQFLEGPAGSGEGVAGS